MGILHSQEKATLHHISSLLFVSNTSTKLKKIKQTLGCSKTCHGIQNNHEHCSISVKS